MTQRNPNLDCLWALTHGLYQNARQSMYSGRVVTTIAMSCNRFQTEGVGKTWNGTWQQFPLELKSIGFVLWTYNLQNKSKMSIVDVFTASPTEKDNFCHPHLAQISNKFNSLRSDLCAKNRWIISWNLHYMNWFMPQKIHLSCIACREFLNNFPLASLPAKRNLVGVHLFSTLYRNKSSYFLYSGSTGEFYLSELHSFPTRWRNIFEFFLQTFNYMKSSLTFHCWICI